ncbi:MAG: YciI family protein [Ginsengibacter sp.]
MKTLFFYFFLILADFSYAQTINKVDTAAQKFEMKQYWFVMLVRGHNRTHDSVTSAKIQEGHMANINAMAKSGKLLVAGPFGDDGQWRGILILDCKTQTEAEDMVKKDPAIIAGRLSYEIHPWWTAKNAVFK